ncbi:MAG: hypothetical protein FWD04_10155, partial [Conexibacteraceae bacterium]|nr:hypothetical protein [Conexibacteraceae bacterium]
MADPVEQVDIRDATRSALEAFRSERGKGLANLIEWAQKPEWPVEQRVGVVLHFAWRAHRTGKDTFVADLGDRLMSASYEDPGLGAALRSHGALMRAVALNRLEREDDAWALLSAAIAEHLCDPNPASYLAKLLAVAADSLAAMGLAEETALCRSLADDAAAAAAGGRASLSLAAGVGMLLHRAGADEDALSVFTWSVEAFGRDGSRDEVRVAIAGRAQALLSLARFDECVLACGDGLGAIVGQA